MWKYNYVTSDEDSDELYHYGVLGMKWGVHRVRMHNKSYDRLASKASRYEQKAIKKQKKSENYHAKYDLKSSNKAMKKALRYEKKAMQNQNKADKADALNDKLFFEQKAAKMNYKAADRRIEANRKAKAAGYGKRALFYSIRSDVYKRKAAKIKLKIANNKRYDAMMSMKMSELSNNEKYKAQIAEIKAKYANLL